MELYPLQLKYARLFLLGNFRRVSVLFVEPFISYLLLDQMPYQGPTLHFILPECHDTVKKVFVTFTLLIQCVKVTEHFPLHLK